MAGITETIGIRLPLWALNEIKDLSEFSGLPVATTIKRIVCEKLREDKK